MTPVLSVVSAYNNRRESFKKTLDSIIKSKYKNDIEIVIVDDCSDENQRISDLSLTFPFLKVIEITRENRTWRNPCVPFNIAMKASSGKIILLQNPENYHVTDIIGHAIENLQREDYFTYKVFALTEEQSKDINNTISTVPFESISSAGIPNGWYNHPIYRAGYYHFVSAIYSDVLKNDLGGFDERYSQGWGFDDDDLIIRINRRGLKKCIVNDHLALHQWHPCSVPFYPTNESLRYITLSENKIKANE